MAVRPPSQRSIVMGISSRFVAQAEIGERRGEQPDHSGNPEKILHDSVRSEGGGERRDDRAIGYFVSRSSAAGVEGVGIPTAAKPYCDTIATLPVTLMAGAGVAAVASASCASAGVAAQAAASRRGDRKTWM